MFFAINYYITNERQLKMAEQDNSNETYPVMPLRNTVLFPQQVIPTYIGRERSLKLIDLSLIHI